MSERFAVSPADLAACRQMIRDGSKSFHLASLLLPERVRDPARGLYAFCRVADDAIDKEPGGLATIEALQTRLAAIYDGRPGPHPADRAFVDIAERFSIPRALPEALIEGFAWDVEGKTYSDISAVRAYAARVAGSVGAMMAVIMGVREAVALARACDLGIAMQLTNIARDVGEDARAGRLYLPRDWLQAQGIDPASWLGSPVFDRSIGAVIAQLLAEADRLYARAGGGIAMLPLACRPAIDASRKLYAEIGREVERRGHDSVSGRAVVPKARKLKLLMAATAALAFKPPAPPEPALPEAQFLVDAVVQAPLPRVRQHGFEAQAAWVIDLFARLEAQRR